jgi:hypothetical protein
MPDEPTDAQEEAVEEANTPVEETPVEEPEDTADSADQPEEESEVFPRDYVEKLRQENGRYRQRAQRADELAHRLHVELVKATGRLADPTDLPFDENHLDDTQALADAVEALLNAKPHLASRRPTGEIGQGPATTSGTVDLAALLRQRAV